MQQHAQQDEVQYGLLESLWGGAGGLQGNFPLTKPFMPQQQHHHQQQQQDEEQQQQGEEEAAAAAAADKLEPLKQGSFFFLASLFFEEREAQQMAQHRRILRELDGVLVPLSGAVECISRLEAKCVRLRALREKLLLCSAGLQAALKHVLQRQAQAEAVSKCIEQRLRRYTQLDVLKQQLQKPPVLAKAGLGSRQAVEVSALASCLTQIEDSLQFFASHLTYRNAEANLCAYEALRTRCLSILLSAALHHMQYTEDLLQARVKEKQQQQDGKQSLDLSILHVQFEVLMAPTRPVMQILKDKQSLGLSGAYQRTLEQLYEQYVNMRSRLLLPPLKRQLQQLLLSSDTLPEAARALVSRASSVSALEIRLFASFSISSPHEAALRFLLEQIATSAYDELCPAVLACNGVEDLCDIRETLLLEMLAGGRTLGEDAVPLLQKLHQLVTDVQERLFFRLEVSVDEEIRGFHLNTRHLNREWLLEQTYPTVLKALHLVLLLQQRSTRQQSEGGGLFAAAAAAAAEDPLDAACSDVIAAVLSSLQTAASAASAAGLRFFVPGVLPQDAAGAADQAATQVESLLLFFSLLSDVLGSYEERFVRSERKLALPGAAASFFQLLRLGGPAAIETQEQQQPAAAAAAAAAAPVSKCQEPQKGGFFGALLPRVSETTFNAAAAVQAALAAACRDFVAAAVALTCVSADELLASVHSRTRAEAVQLGSPERAAAIRALPCMQREALRAKLHAFVAAAESLLPPLVKLLLPSLTPEYLSGETELFLSPHAAPNQEDHEEEALLNVDFLLQPVLEGFFTKLREVDALLMKEAQFEAATLEAVGWGCMHAEKLEKQIREAVRRAATEAFEKAREKRAAAAAAARSGQVTPRPIAEGSNTKGETTPKETAEEQRHSEAANKTKEASASKEIDIPQQ
ncbi:hypothetical protein Esti_005942 [Eimeria stiedai]